MNKKTTAETPVETIAPDSSHSGETDGGAPPVAVQVLYRTRVWFPTGPRAVNPGVYEDAAPELVSFARLNPEIAKILE
jgi:hypothetical protein